MERSLPQLINTRAPSNTAAEMLLTWNGRHESFLIDELNEQKIRHLLIVSQ
jgi:hypothetical protein